VCCRRILYSVYGFSAATPKTGAGNDRDTNRYTYLARDSVFGWNYYYSSITYILLFYIPVSPKRNAVYRHRYCTVCGVCTRSRAWRVVRQLQPDICRTKRLIRIAPKSTLEVQKSTTNNLKTVWVVVTGMGRAGVPHTYFDFATL